MCPNCGAPLDENLEYCIYCGSSLIIENISHLELLNNTSLKKYLHFYEKLLEENSKNGKINYALGLLYYQLKLYKLARKYFEIALEIIPHVSDLYFYLALSIIEDKEIKTLKFSDVKICVKYTEISISICNIIPKYYLLLASIKYHYYLKHSMKVNGPKWDELLFIARTLENYENDKAIMQKYLTNLDDLFTKNL